MACKHWATASVVALALTGGALHAQTMTDPGDLAFWQSIQNSNNKAELRAYLQAFPNGRFAGLVRARLGDDPAPPAPPPDSGGGSDYTVSITPTAGRVGQQFQPSCGTVPYGVTFDQLVIVPAGTPVTQPGTATETSRVLWSIYTRQCDSVPKVGPFAPGAYEMRWMTSLFNNDQPTRYELKAKASFTVR